MGACIRHYSLASLAVWNHLKYRPGQVSILLLFVVKLVIESLEVSAGASKHIVTICSEACIRIT